MVVWFKIVFVDFRIGFRSMIVLIDFNIGNFRECENVNYCVRGLLVLFFIGM